jgi:hypothetical protein
MDSTAVVVSSSDRDAFVDRGVDLPEVLGSWEWPRTSLLSSLCSLARTSSGEPASRMIPRRKYNTVSNLSIGEVRCTHEGCCIEPVDVSDTVRHDNSGLGSE